MEVDTALVAFGVSLLLIALSILRSLTSSKEKFKLPPGPWRLPLIGNAHIFLAGSKIHRTMASLAKKHGPLMYIKLGEVPIVVVTSPEVAQTILKTHDVAFADRYSNATLSAATFYGKDLPYGPYGERWRQLRKICTMDLLSTTRVKSFQRIREDEAARAMRDLASAAAAGATVNIADRISKLVTDTFLRECIGSRSAFRDDYLHALQMLIRQMTFLNAADLFPSSKIMQMLSTGPRNTLVYRDRMVGFIEKIIAERKKSMDATGTKEPSFLDVLLTLQKEGTTQIPMTNETIIILLFDMFGAGSETSTTTLTWTMAELLHTPRVMAKLQAELRQSLQGKTTFTEDDIAGMTYLRMVIKESLRLHCPIPLLARKCRETCQIMGYDIPKGTSVYTNIWALSRDPKYWDNAEEFIPERFENSTIDFRGNDYEFLPFGTGRRNCVGMNMGLANLEFALASLVYHFDWKLPNGMEPKDLDMSEATGLVASKVGTLLACPVTRIAPSDA